MHPLLDDSLPLLDDTSHTEFSHHRTLGRVHDQRTEAGSKNLHPTIFYVDFPADSGHFYEVNANRLVGLLAERSASRRYTREDFANILSRVQQPLMPVLKASRP